MPNIDLSILNQRQTPAFYADILANRPAAGFIGRIFVSTNTFEFYRDNGTTWNLIGGPGAGTVTGSGAAGQVTYWNGASTVTGDNGLFYDAVNDRLGIGTITPGAAIDAHSTQSTILQLNQTAINDTRIAFQLSGSALWRLGNFYNGGANDFELFDVIGAQSSVTVKKTTGQVLIGTTTVGSGKLVVASATGDNGIQIVGASAPSLRLDNAATGPTKRVGLGIATALNNFIQGAVDRDFCIFNGSTTAASPILFGVYDAGLTNVQEAARISAARNFIINSSTDAGFRFDVNGTARFVGVVTGNANINGLTISNNNSNPVIGSDGTNVQIGSNQLYRITFASNRINLNPSDGTSSIPSMSVSSLNSGSVFIGGNANPTAKLQVGGSITASTNLAQGVFLNNTLVAAANNDVLVGLDINPTFTNGAFTGVTNYAIRTQGSGISLFNGGINSGQGFVNTTNGLISLSGVGNALIRINANATTNASRIEYQQASSAKWYGGINTNSDFSITTDGGASNGIAIFQSTKNVTIGTATDAGFRLDVNGTIRSIGAIRTDAGNDVLALNLLGTSSSIQATPSNGTSRISLNSQSITATLSCTANSFYELRSATPGATLRIGTSASGSTGGGIEYYASFNSPAGYHKWFYVGVEYMRLQEDKLIIGTISSDNSAQLQVNTTTRGFLPPRLTTAQKNAIATPATGLVLYDTTLNKLAVYTGAAWETVTSV